MPAGQGGVVPGSSRTFRLAPLKAAAPPERQSEHNLGALDPDPWDNAGMDLLAASTSVPMLFLEFGCLLLGLGLLARVADRLAISAVPLYLLAGLFFGEGGLVGIAASDDFVRAIAELGVVILLLLLGLEYRAESLLDGAKSGMLTAVTDLVLNAAPGAVMALLFGWGPVGAVALGGVTYVSSSGIISQLLKDFGWQQQPETPKVIRLLITEDLVMAPYLPILTVMLTGVGLTTGLLTVGAALIVVAAVIAVGILSSHSGARLLSPTDPVSLLLIVFGAAITAAGLAGVVGFSPAVAAFLVGLLLRGEVAAAARRRLDPLRDMLAAVFFAYFGLTTDPGEIPAVMLPAALLTVVTMGTKFLTARTFGGLDSESKYRAGALLSTRGEFSVVIAGLTAVSGALPPTFHALAATYVIFTAAIAPFLARRWRKRPTGAVSVQPAQ